MPNGLLGPPPQVNPTDPASVGAAIQWLTLGVFTTYEHVINLDDKYATLETRQNMHDDYHGKDDKNTQDRIAVRKFLTKPFIIIGGTGIFTVMTSKILAIVLKHFGVNI